MHLPPLIDKIAQRLSPQLNPLCEPIVEHADRSHGRGTPHLDIDVRAYYQGCYRSANLVSQISEFVVLFRLELSEICGSLHPGFTCYFIEDATDLGQGLEREREERERRRVGRGSPWLGRGHRRTSAGHDDHRRCLPFCHYRRHRHHQ